MWPHDPDQERLNFNPLEFTDEERAPLRRLFAQWAREEAEEDFGRLPGESLSEFLVERDRYLNALETFGPTFPREPCIAWQLMHEKRRAVLPTPPRQLTLPFDGP